MIGQIGEMLTVSVVNVIAAVIILVVGWIVALVIAGAVRGALQKTKFGEKLKEWSGEEQKTGTEDIARWASKLVFYVVMFFVLIGFFQFLGLQLIAEPLNVFLIRLFQYLPMVFGALILGFIAWILATVLRIVVARLLVTAKIDQRLGEQAEIEEEKKLPLSQTISKAVFWVVILLFLPAILTALQLHGLLLPVQNMTDRVLTFLPNILAAALILILGWFLARILKRITIAILSSLGVDNLSERLGVAQVMGRQQISRLLGLLVYALVIIVTIIAALNALTLDAITQPASNMLNMILEALPAVFAAILVLVIAYLVATVVKGLLTNLLEAAGFNAILARLGIGSEQPEGKWTPAEAAGYIALVIIMLFATIEAAGLLGFVLLSDLIAQLLIFVSYVLLGLAIFGIGLYLANLAYKAIKVSETPQALFLARVARYAILILAGAMALQRMGLANEIILLAFGLILATIAVSFILAFGLGGRDIAARELDTWIKQLKKEK